MGKISRAAPRRMAHSMMSNCCSLSSSIPSSSAMRKPSPLSLSQTPISPGASSIISSSHSARTEQPARSMARSASPKSTSSGAYTATGRWRWARVSVWAMPTNSPI